MRPRFQADNDLRSAIRLGVLRQEPAIDFRSARDAVLDGVEDLDVLRRCANDRRVLVSHDKSTMPAAFRSFVAAGNRSSGLLLVAQKATIGRVIESILLVWIATEAEEWTNRIEWLPL